MDTACFKRKAQASIPFEILDDLSKTAVKSSAEASGQGAVEKASRKNVHQA